MGKIDSRFHKMVGLGAVVIVLAGCATPCCDATTQTPLGAASRKITAVGHGSSGNYGQYGAGQQRLMATRAAQVDAYRNLVERVHGFQVSGATAVSAFATQSDTVRSYVDAYIRGARLVGVTAGPDGTYEATVELDLTSQFVACVQAPSSCSIPSPMASSGTNSMMYIGGGGD